MANAPFTLMRGLLDAEDDAHEYNPEGYWLSNTETNSVFILPEDLYKVRELISNACALEQT